MNDEDYRAEAARTEKENPEWIVIFGAYSKQFVCMPRFTVPPGIMVIALYPAALPSRFREVERTYLKGA